MSITDFPTDVRLVLKGDYAGAQELAARARGVLARALELADRNGGKHATVSTTFPTGTITAQIIGEQKIVTVTVPPQGVEVPEEPPPEVPRIEEVTPRQIGLLSGWIRGPTFTSTTIGTPPQARKILHDYRPIPETAAAYHLTDAFQAMRRLGYSQTNTIRPGMFSGTMKRVVQAIFGIGHVGDPSEMKDQSPRYIDNSVPLRTRNVPVAYLWKWDATHGIYKAGEKNHWVVEISRANGVLAMPLILMPDTTDPGYRIQKNKIGDVGTVRVLDEFGGIPTGETLPAIGPALEAAITAGKVLRLLGASDMDAFYGHHFAFSNAFGWAFSESGSKAVNTAMSQRDETFTSFASISGPVPPYLCSEYWQIALELSPHDRKNPLKDPPEPVGTGTATLKQLHIGRIDYDQTLGQYWVPPADGLAVDTGLRHPALWSTAASPYQHPPPTFSSHGDYSVPDFTGWGAVVHAFFDGERPERLKWVPAQGIRGGVRHEFVLGKYPPSGYLMTYNAQCTGETAAADAWYGLGPYVIEVQRSGTRSSPGGFVGDSVEVRTENRTDQQFPNGDPGGVPSNVAASGGHFAGPPPVIQCQTVLHPVCTGSVTPRDDCTLTVALFIPPDPAFRPNPAATSASLPPDLGEDTYDPGQNGHFVSSTIYGFVPVLCREGYIAVESLTDLFVLTTWTNPSDEGFESIDWASEREAFRANDVCCGVYADIVFPGGSLSEEDAAFRATSQRPFSTTERETTKIKTAVGFFAAAGRLVFDVAPERPDPTLNVRWGFNADAGPSEQFVTQNGYEILLDTAVAYYRVNLPEGLSDRAVAEKTNWIGTV